ncbi:MAG: hypothetical protein AAGI01_05490, partial [Myxococcota bacterium]
MSEAQLLIKPTLLGNARGKLRGLRDGARRFGVEQGRMLRSGEARVRGLERAWSGLGTTIRGTSNGLKRALGMMGSMQALVLGAGALGAGKTFVDLTIGSNAQLETQLVTFRTMIGDARKADELMRRINRYAASTPFAQADLIEGSKRLLRLTGANIGQNEKLLRLASQMAAVNPSKSISDAAEAILDAEGLEFERLKEFGLKLKKQDIARAKKRGEKIGQTALRAVEDAVRKQTGGRDVVGALSQTLTGKLSTARDQFRATMRKVGEPAFEVLKKGFDEVNAEFAKLGKDAGFKKDLA